MQVIHAALLQVIQLFLYTAQGAGKGLWVEHHPKPASAAVPVGLRLALTVGELQAFWAGQVCLLHGAYQGRKGVAAPLIYFTVEPFQLIIPGGKPGIEFFCHYTGSSKILIYRALHAQPFHIRKYFLLGGRVAGRRRTIVTVRIILFFQIRRKAL